MTKIQNLQVELLGGHITFFVTNQYMEQKKSKYFATAEEVRILRSYQDLYFRHDARTELRKIITKNCLEKLDKSIWTEDKVRAWFNNNGIELTPLPEKNTEDISQMPVPDENSNPIMVEETIGKGDTVVTKETFNQNSFKKDKGVKTPKLIPPSLPVMPSIEEYCERNLPKVQIIQFPSDDNNEEIILKAKGDGINPSSHQTPDFIVDFFYAFDGSYTPPSELQERIHNFTYQHQCKYVAVHTGTQRKSQTFACINHDVMKCPAFIRYYYNERNKLFVETGCHQHNHLLSDITPKKARNALTSTEKAVIRERTENGDMAVQIRKDPNQSFGTISKNILYSERKKVLDAIRENDIPLMESEFLRHPNWNSKIYTIRSQSQNYQFLCSYSYHMPIMRSNYSNDVIIIDDTSCTNHYYLPLVALIVEDQNGKNQLLSFALINNRTKESFIHYFEQIAIHIPEVNAFVTDRNIAQIEALKTVWPNANIIYCRVHIGRNIKDKVGNDMYDLYQQMIANKITEEILLGAFQYKIENDPKVSNFLQKLIDCSDCWLPSRVNRIKHKGNVTTNRVEGFFYSHVGFCSQRG